MQITIGYINRLFSDGLESIISGFDDFEVVQSFSIPKMVSLLKGNGFPVNFNGTEIIILECDHPCRSDLTFIKFILKSHPEIRIFLISYLPDHRIGGELLESGISAYILKDCSQVDLLTGLTKIMDHKNYFCSDITKALVVASLKDIDEHDSLLTNREKEILTFLVHNHTTCDVADKLKISANTVKTHKRNIQAKLGAHSILDLFMYALRNNLVDFGEHDLCMECPYFNEN